MVAALLGRVAGLACSSWNALSPGAGVGSCADPTDHSSPPCSGPCWPLPLHSSHEHSLICFRQSQVDYLEPLIRLLKIILLPFGFVSFFPEVNQQGLRGCSSIHLKELSCWACPEALPALWRPTFYLFSFHKQDTHIWWHGTSCSDLICSRVELCPAIHTTSRLMILNVGSWAWLMYKTWMAIWEGYNVIQSRLVWGIYCSVLSWWSRVNGSAQESCRMLRNIHLPLEQNQKCSLLSDMLFGSWHGCLHIQEDMSCGKCV